MMISRKELTLKALTGVLLGLFFWLTLDRVVLVIQLMRLASVDEPVPNVFILSGSIGGFWNSYGGLENALANSMPGTPITIKLNDNPGGFRATSEDLVDQMRASKAIIHTRAYKWVASSALDIFFAGDFVHVPKKQGPLGLAHLTTPRTEWNRQNDLAFLPYYREFLTKDQWNRVIAGEDVLIYGPQICHVNKARVVKETAEECVIKPLRSKG